MGAIDGSHILVNAPSIDPAQFYNQKGFYSVFLQGIVDMETTFWDKDFGWATSLHDYTLFVNSVHGRKLIRDDYLTLVNHVCAFQGIQGEAWALQSTLEFHSELYKDLCGVCFWDVERVLQILLRHVEMQLANMANIVVACIFLHNLCIMHKDFGDENLIAKAKKWLLDMNIANFGDL